MNALMIALLYFSGIVFLLVATVYADSRTRECYLTSRDFSDFSGDVQAWLHREEN